MCAMDASQSALDSLRTVEFRETLKGYHRDDVDEYLEKAAVEAEGLQEQLRQSGERLRQAAERISQLETALEQKPVPEPQPAAEPVVADDTLQRTLILAQKFVDETKSDSEAQALKIIAEADAKAHQMTDEAQSRASRIAAESEQRLREEINRLQESRSTLTHEVEAMSHHLESERNRLRAALGDILRWVDENVQPAAAAAPPFEPEAGSDDGKPAPAPADSQGNRTMVTPTTGSPRTSGTGAGGDVTQMRPGGATARTAAGNAPLPL
jgi:DivIVA domain-containing protein